MFETLLVLGPGLVLLSCLAIWLTPSQRSWRWLPKAFLVGWMLTYATSLGVTFLDPVWYDNGRPETIRFPAHFGWALWTTTLWQFAIVPLVVGLYWSLDRENIRVAER